MHRLRGFDYTTPYYYMVTIDRLPGLLPFSSVVDGKLVENDLTKAFTEVILNFHHTWYVLEPIWCFTVMPDHIHLLLKIAPVEKRMSLGSLVYQLMKALSLAYWRVVGADESAPGNTHPAPRVAETGSVRSPPSAGRSCR